MRVSTIIPCYNGERYLGEAIDSALGQTVAQLEVIVVDDGSTSNGPRDIAARYGDAVRYVRKENGGLSSARNVGIAEATGDIVAFLDDDDVWMPDKIEKQLALYGRLEQTGRRVGLIGTAFIYTDENLNELSRMSMPYAGSEFDRLIFKDIVGLPSSVIVPRAVLSDVGGFDESLRASEDYDLWLRIASRYDIHSVDEYLVRYRQRRGTLSKDPEKMVQTNRRVTEMLIERERLDSETIDAVQIARRRDYAMRYRQYAYDLLKLDGDIAGYRRELKRAAAFDRKAVSAKDRLVNLLPRAYRALL